MIRIRYLMMFCFLAGALSLSGQEDFYDPDSVREIKIRFTEPNWRYILDSLFRYVGDNGKLTGDVTIDGSFYPNAGIRYKGYSSYDANEIKNPFNIDLDYHVTNQNHLGHVKLKLSNVIHDPSFVREVLAYEIVRKYMPASLANYANLYVNDTLIGLYTNIEAVDKLFTDNHWGSKTNSFFKGEPVKLSYPFGQNANLALTHGADSSGYYSFYNMESDWGWNDLFHLVERLDKGADSVKDILNTDRALWMHALNETLLNLDSYIAYSQNYYLFMDDNGQFNPIIWDLNMSFGSFRESDGSRNFLGVSIDEVKQLDPIGLMDFTISPRPLMTKLFSNDTVRKIYFAHMRTILDENIRNGWYFSRATQLQTLVDPDVRRDTNRFYSYDDFLQNLTVTVGGAGSMKEYPGLRDLMEARMAYLDTLPGFSGAPVITEVNCSPEAPVRNDSCRITARISGATMAMMGYRFSTGGKFARIPMLDDGNHYDGLAGDGIYGALTVLNGHTLQYYLYAQNDSAGALSPERAEFEFYEVQPEILPGDVTVNEVNTSESSGCWIELCNNTTESLQLQGMAFYMDRGSDPFYILADTVIPAKKFIVVTSPGNPLKDGRGMPFFLPSAGGSLQFLNASGRLVDSLSYGIQVPGKTSGRYPNGYGPMTYMPPTRGGYNAMGTTPGTGFLMYPNPAREYLNLELGYHAKALSLNLFNNLGKPVVTMDIPASASSGHTDVVPVNLPGLSAGLYLVQLTGNGSVSAQKLIIY